MSHYRRRTLREKRIAMARCKVNPVILSNDPRNVGGFIELYNLANGCVSELPFEQVRDLKYRLLAILREINLNDFEMRYQLLGRVERYSDICVKELLAVYTTEMIESKDGIQITLKTRRDGKAIRYAKLMWDENFPGCIMPNQYVKDMPPEFKKFVSIMNKHGKELRIEGGTFNGDTPTYEVLEHYHECRIYFNMVRFVNEMRDTVSPKSLHLAITWHQARIERSVICRRYN